MSKTDELRAMRDAKYARARAASGRAPAPAASAPSTPAPVAPPAAKAPAASTTPGDEAASDAVGGHRNMGGRTCTREQGHAAKSHRYS